MIPPLTDLESVEPDSLLEQCVRYAVHHFHILTEAYPDKKRFHLRQDLTLPCEIWEQLLEMYQSSGYVCDDAFAQLFDSPWAGHLKRIKLRNSTITDEGLRILLKFYPVELDLRNCTQLTEASLDYLNSKGHRLVSLSLDSSLNVLPVDLSSYCERNWILNTPNLKKLTIKKLYLPEKKIFFPLMLQNLTKLTYLDLSGCVDLDDLSYIKHLKHLTSLILFNVPMILCALESIMSIKTLRHLDISKLRTYGLFEKPNLILAMLVQSLPNLVSLDISGTNLAGTGVADQSLKEGENYMMTDIPGLKSRVNNPLEFLGLYKTHHEACKRHNIPAKKITGDANEEQILNALQAYLDRTDILIHVLNDLFHLCRLGEFQNVDAALSLLLEAMDRYLNERVIQTLGSAVSYFMAKYLCERNCAKIKLKRRLIRSLINAMGAFQDDITISKNVCIALIQFDLPNDVLFEYDRLALLLVLVLSELEHHHSREGREVLRYGVSFLNALACRVDEAQRLLLGNLGTVDRMLAIIADYLESGTFDEVLEVAWSTLWNVTDETIENCEKFIAKNGMELFLGCCRKFSRKVELLRNMMGLMGNVAEMKPLRGFLMTERFILVLDAMLFRFYRDGVEISYNAAGILAHLCSDGVEAWTVKSITRKDILKKMVGAIEEWDLTTQRNINYRSFQPIFSLLRVNHTEECKYWAVWALANFTTVCRERYCPLVYNDGGIDLLEKVANTEHSYTAINKLARIVLKNCEEMKGR